VDRGKKSTRNEARLSAAAIVHSIAELHAKAHEEATRSKSKQVTVAGEFSPEPAHARAKDELFLLVFNSGSYALHAITQPVAAIDALSSLGPDSLHRLVDSVATYVVHSPDTFLGGTASVPGDAGLTEGERRALVEGGVVFEQPKPQGQLSAAARTQLEFAKLRVDALNVEEVARMLKVDPSRVRQRLTGRTRTLFGIKVGRSWRVPTFQFEGRRTVPGIEVVVSRLPLDLSPVAVHRWFTSPNPDLEIDDERVSPLDWLKAGNDPERVSELAGAL